MPGGPDLGFAGRQLVLKGFRPHCVPAWTLQTLEAAVLSSRDFPLVMPPSCGLLPPVPGAGLQFGVAGGRAETGGLHRFALPFSIPLPGCGFQT